MRLWLSNILAHLSHFEYTYNTMAISLSRFCGIHHSSKSNFNLVTSGDDDMVETRRAVKDRNSVTNIPILPGTIWNNATLKQPFAMTFQTILNMESQTNIVHSHCLTLGLIRKEAQEEMMQNALKIESKLQTLCDEVWCWWLWLHHSINGRCRHNSN